MIFIQLMARWTFRIVFIACIQTPQESSCKLCFANKLFSQAASSVFCKLYKLFIPKQKFYRMFINNKSTNNWVTTLLNTIEAYTALLFMWPTNAGAYILLRCTETSFEAPPSTNRQKKTHSRRRLRERLRSHGHSMVHWTALSEPQETSVGGTNVYTVYYTAPMDHNPHDRPDDADSTYTRTKIRMSLRHLGSMIKA